VNTDDVWSPIINLPFNFCYYGVNYNTVNIGSNGSIQFGPTSGGGFAPWSFTASCPSTALAPAGDVFGVYHDTDPSVGGTIKWYLLGTAPCRIFVVSFNNVPHYLTSCNNLTSRSMIVLYETTNVIDIYVENKPTCAAWNNGNAIIGIQNPAGSAGLAAPGRNTGTSWSVTTPEGWRFTPNGAPNYTVAWFQGATQIGTGNTINVCPGGPATYTAQVTYNRCDGTQITSQDQVSVSFSSLTAPTVTPTAETCNNYNNGSVVINNPVGAGPYTVNITGPVNGSVVEPNTAAGVASFTNLPDGSYSYTVAGANGCTTSGTFTIAPGPSCCSVTATGANVLCSGSSTGSTTANPVGIAPFTYTWTGGGQTGQTATNLAAGTYTVTMTDNTGCTATASATITQPTAVSATTVQVNANCNGTCNGTITVNATGGTAPYQYSINGGAYQASNVFTALCAGSYTISIRDANNCTITLTRTITQPTPLTVAVTTIVPATCGANNGSITVAGSGGTAGYTYSIGAVSQPGAVFPNMAPGTYTVNITDANGCTSSVSATVTAVSTPIASILNQQNVSCFGGSNGSVLVGATGGIAPITYSLNGGPFQTSNSFGSLPIGSYTATVKDANNCTATATFTITSPTQLTFTALPTATSCNGLCNGQVLINASGGTAPYQFSANNGTTYSTVNPITGLCAGATNIVVRDANGCLSNMVVNITQPPVLTATFTHTDPVCNGACDGTVTVSATGGTPSYQYSANGGTLQASNILTSLCSGGSTILVQDSQGCQFTATETLTDPPGYGIDTVSVTESNCGFNNGAITVQANGLNGPFQYSLEGGPFQSSGTFTSLLGGAYSVVAIDQLGCQEQVFFGINDVEMDGIVLTQTDALCFGSPDGQIEVTNVSGALPITFELDNNGMTQTSGVFPNLAEGSHVVTIYDGGLCVFTIPFFTDQPDLITFNTTVTDVICYGSNTGQIDFINVAGGTGAFQFSIDNGTTFQSGSSFTGLSSGTYDLVVMDSNNCTVTGTATIVEAPELLVDQTIFDLTCNGDSTGFVQFVASGGSGNYEFSIDNGATFSPTGSFFNLPAGTYDVVIHDDLLCQLTQQITITEPPLLTATFATTDALCNGSCDGELVITAAGGTLPYLYSIDNGTTFVVSPTISSLCANTYPVLIKDSNNCTVSSAEVISEPAGLNVTITLTPSTCSQQNGEIDIAATGGTGAYTFSIDNGTTTSATGTFTGLLAGNYDIAVADQNNCPFTSTETLDDESSPIIAGAFITDATCNGVCDGIIVVQATGGTGVLTYSIGTPQSDSTITGICAGNYTLTVSDNNGCQDSDPITIGEPAVLTFTTTSADLTCFGDNSGEITFTAAGGTSPYLYSTDNGTTFTSQSTSEFLSAGTYDVMVQDQNDCSATAQVVVSEPAQLTVLNQASTDATCNDQCDGDATVALTGGVTPYDYTWSTGATATNTVNGLCAGSYEVIGNDANGCEVTATFLINEPAPLTIVSISSTDVLCNGDCNGSITINCPAAIEFSVDNGATFQASNVFNGLCTGTYAIVVRDAIGCTQDESVTIGQPQPLVQNAIPEDGITICYDGFGTLSASATGGTQPYYFVWNTGDTVQYLNVNLTIPATFTCTVTDQNGCVSNAATADVAIRPKFIPSVTTPVSVCPGQQAYATASGVDGLPGYVYQWLTETSHDTLAEGDNYSYIPATSETILMVGRDACFSYDTLEVEIIVFDLPEPDFIVTPAIGCSPLDAVFTNTTDAGTVGTCVWTWGDGTSSTGNNYITHQYVPVGCYDVTLEVTSPEGCVQDTTIVNAVCVVDDPVADFSFAPINPTTVNSQVNFTDQSTEAVSYQWDFGQFGSSTLQNPSVSYADVSAGDQLVCLTVTSLEGCTDETCQPITFQEEFMMHIPNSFTPDEDEYNPLFTPVFPPNTEISDYTFFIFNRWGEVIFESHDWNTGWDGTYAGQYVKEGVYTWTIVLTGGPAQKRFSAEGHVNVLR
jgi:gliding motility-associated-like protein